MNERSFGRIELILLWGLVGISAAGGMFIFSGLTLVATQIVHLRLEMMNDAQQTKGGNQK